MRKLVKEQGRTEELEEASGSAGGRDKKAEGGGERRRCRTGIKHGCESRLTEVVDFMSL